MAIYAFETITATEALSLQPGDQIIDSTATAGMVTVTYAADQINVTLAGHMIVFSSELAQISQTNGFNFTDGSILYIGDNGANTENLGFGSPLSGAFFGGDGADVFSTGSGSSVFQGNAGADHFTVGPEGSNTIYGGQGDDVVSIAAGGPVGAGHNFVQGNLGQDWIFGGVDSDTLLGGQGDDTILGNFGVDFINGNLGDDHIFGSGRLFGEGGADTIDGGTSGLNVISGGDGDDHLLGDFLASGPGSPAGAQNQISGDAGDDLISSASPAQDTLQGGDGNDTLSTNNNGGHDVLEGGDGADRIIDDASTSTLGGNGGYDVLDGGDGADTITADVHTSILGGSGDDQIHVDNPYLINDPGLNTIDGGAGKDLIYGGGGPDTFAMSAGSSAAVDGQSDQIMNWSHDDKIEISGLSVSQMTYKEWNANDYAEALTLFKGEDPAKTVLAVQIGADVVVFGDPDGVPGPDGLQAIVLVGRSLANIDASNFI